jgi:hypothetical protein
LEVEYPQALSRGLVLVKWWLLALPHYLMGMNRWAFRVAAYATLMTDTYPPFRLDMGGQEPAPDAAAPTPSRPARGRGLISAACPDEPRPGTRPRLADARHTLSLTRIRTPSPNDSSDPSAPSAWTGC